MFNLQGNKNYSRGTNGVFFSTLQKCFPSKIILLFKNFNILKDEAFKYNFDNKFNRNMMMKGKLFIFTF